MGCTPTRAASTVHPLSSNEPPPDAPSTTPRQPNQPSTPGTPQDTELANELEQRLLSHMASSKGQYTRQLSVGGDGAADNGRTEVSASAVNGKGRPEPNTQPPVPPKSIRYPLQLQFASDSQVDFFKMLDKKISEGRDFIPEKERNRTPSSQIDS